MPTTGIKPATLQSLARRCNQLSYDSKTEKFCEVLFARAQQASWLKFRTIAFMLSAK